MALSPVVKRVSIVAAACVCASLVVLGVLVAPFVSSALTIRTEAQAALAALSSGSFDIGEARLRATQAEIAALSTRLDDSSWYEFIPLVGSEYRVTRERLRGVEQALQGMITLTNVAGSVSETYTSILVSHDASVAGSASWASLSRDERRQVFSTWAQESARLHESRDHLSAALTEFQRAGGLDAPFLPAAFRSFMNTVPLWHDRLVQVFSALDLFGPLAGYPQPKTYLVVLQNADEMRPSGGFVGVIGEVRVDAGSVEKMEFGDVYALDKLVEGKWSDVPPAVLNRELGTKAWYLRDQNWSPDFPTTARSLASAYVRERSVAIPGYAGSVDGVIALEPRLFRAILERTGPLVVDGVTYSADTFFDQLQYQVEQGFLQNGVGVDHRKEIVAHLGTALFAKLMSEPRDRWLGWFDLVFASLTQKDIQIWMRDPSLQALLDARGWNGRAMAATQDYLWVVDANLAALKTDGMMDKHIQYTLDAHDPNRPLATVTLTYTNNTKQIDWRYTRYRDYVRVYVPDGSEFVSSDAPGSVDVMHELGKTAFGAFWVIEPRQTKSITFTYALPKGLLQPGAYTLLVQRQAGARHALTLDLSFGKKVVRAYPSERSADQGDDRYTVTQPIERDQLFSVDTDAR